MENARIGAQGFAPYWFTPTYVGKIQNHPLPIPPLARSAYSRLERNYKEANPLYILLPDFKGTASLSTGMIPSLESQEPTPVFQPLEDSPAWKKWQRIERDQKKLAREVSKRLRSSDPPASDDSISSFLDEELEP